MTGLAWLARPLSQYVLFKTLELYVNVIRPALAACEARLSALARRILRKKPLHLRNSVRDSWIPRPVTSSTEVFPWDALSIIGPNHAGR